MPVDIPPEQLLLSGADVCRALSIGTSLFHGMRKSGRFPLKPIRLGRAIRFRADELQRWVAAGLPPASRWNFIREQAARLAG